MAGAKFQQQKHSTNLSCHRTIHMLRKSFNSLVYNQQCYAKKCKRCVAVKRLFNNLQEYMGTQLAIILWVMMSRKINIFIWW